MNSKFCPKEKAIASTQSKFPDLMDFRQLLLRFHAAYPAAFQLIPAAKRIPDAYQVLKLNVIPK